MIGSSLLAPLRKTSIWRHSVSPTLEVISRTGRRLGEDSVSLVAGGVAFYAFLSIFPAAACALMVWGLFTTSSDLIQYFEFMQVVIPAEAYDLITKQMLRIADSQSSGMTWGAVLSLVLAL